MIAALYVETNGAYFGIPDVDPWDEVRDARLYAGPYPVVAHPPRRRKQNAAERAEQDALVHLYSQALGMASPADAETGDE